MGRDRGPAARWPAGVGEEETEVLYQPAAGNRAGAVLVLAHGAGSHMEHPTMADLAAALAAGGIGTARFDFLYRRRGSRVPDRMPRLVECLAAVAAAVRNRLEPRRLLLGGHSMGGRAATVLAAGGFACDGLILLAYPLHPAGRTDRLRDEHLPRLAAPVLFLSGTRDALCDRQLMEGVAGRLPSSATLHWLAHADHGYRVPNSSGRTRAEVLAGIGEVAGAWVASVG
ncbi:MAG: alpha/beta fold hydrolase [Gemmatimonadota bacterium]